VLVGLIRNHEITLKKMTNEQKIVAGNERAFFLGLEGVINNDLAG